MALPHSKSESLCLRTMTDYAKSFGAKGLAFIKVENGEWKSPIVKFFTPEEKAALTEKLKIEEGDLILFSADQWLNACEILGKIRIYCAETLKSQGKLTIPTDRFEFLWVIDFPLLSFDKEMNRWYSSHHPFTAPVAEDIPFLKTDPKKVRGQHYDIVVNGVELGGGSIRIHQPDVQKTVFEEVLKLPPELVKARFGYMESVVIGGSLNECSESINSFTVHPDRSVSNRSLFAI